ncbi:MAG: glycoside hydrolase family 65 [Tepidisphaeraceae bacterium]
MNGIDRAAVVARHAVGLQALDPFHPLTVGNGEFAFTADITGVQTFPGEYAEGVPLCTMSQWGWHTTPAGADVKPESIRYTDFDTYGRPVPYLTSAEGQEATFNWLRQNPHRLHLGRIGFQLRTRAGVDATPADLSNIEQTLDLWTGILRSRFAFDGEPVEVETCCGGETDAVAVRVQSRLLADGRLAIVLAFPYGSPRVNAADWNQPAAHHTTLRGAADDRIELVRQLDATTYYVVARWEGRAQFVAAGQHQYRLQAERGIGEIALAVAFSPESDGATPAFDQAKAASVKLWQDYWNHGAAIDFAGSTDPRAHELERRVVLSQYLMRVNCAGSLPPAETGLTCNSWYGKFHLEMHWWHGVHFAAWDRLPLLKRSLAWYEKIMPEARKIAERQGYRGVRWPKMVDAEGIDSPSPIAPLLIWQQPHPIYYAELCYRADPTAQTLIAWREIVEQTAEFMASFAHEVDGVFSLGPPIKRVQENNETERTRNPTFELTYWRWGLKIAQEWRQRAGESRNAGWDHVLEHLAMPPQSDGLYLYHEGLHETYTVWNWEHPAMLGARGMLPGDGIDRETMRRSVEEVMRVWQWDRCWGWDFPLTAMAAARCGRQDLAVDALFAASKKNNYGPSGHVYQRPDLALYLPANGGLLAAVAMMAGGWEGAPAVAAPGFPREGWRVQAEGFRPLP